MQCSLVQFPYLLRPLAREDAKLALTDDMKADYMIAFGCLSLLMLNFMSSKRDLLMKLLYVCLHLLKYRPSTIPYEHGQTSFARSLARSSREGEIPRSVTSVIKAALARQGLATASGFLTSRPGFEAKPNLDPFAVSVAAAAADFPTADLNRAHFKGPALDGLFASSTATCVGLAFFRSDLAARGKRQLDFAEVYDDIQLLDRGRWS